MTGTRFKDCMENWGEIVMSTSMIVGVFVELLRVDCEPLIRGMES